MQLDIACFGVILNFQPVGKSKRKRGKKVFGLSFEKGAIKEHFSYTTVHNNFELLFGRKLFFINVLRRNYKS